MPIDATVGGIAANSYVTLAESQAYFAARLSSATWDAYVDSQQEAALLQAAERLDQEGYLGERVTWTQTMKFPRYGIVDEDSRWVDSSTIPQRIKNAQCELALLLLADPSMFEDDGLERFSRISVAQGEMDLTLRGAAGSSELPSTITRLLGPYWAGSQAAVIRS